MNINNHSADQRKARLTVDIQTNCDGVRKVKDCCIWKAALELKRLFYRQSRKIEYCITENETSIYG